MWTALLILACAAGLVLFLRSLLGEEVGTEAGHPVLLGLFSLTPFVLLWAAEPTNAGPELSAAEPALGLFLGLAAVLGAAALRAPALKAPAPRSPAPSTAALRIRVFLPWFRALGGHGGRR